MVKRDALHAEGSSYGTKANVPQIESVLTLVRQHQLNMVKVKCHHLKRKEEDYCKKEQCSIRGSMCMEEVCILTLDVDLTLAFCFIAKQVGMFCIVLFLF